MSFPAVDTKCFMHSREESFCRKVAEILMVDADGGDDPAAVVKYAIDKAHAEVKAEEAAQTAKTLKDEASAV